MVLVGAPASAMELLGSVETDATHIQGDVAVSTPAAITRVGGPDLGTLATPPQVRLDADEVRIRYDFQRVVGAQYATATSVSQEADAVTLRDVQGTFDAWSEESPMLGVFADPALGAAAAVIPGSIDRPTLVETVRDDPETVHLLYSSEEAQSVFDAESVKQAPVGSLVLSPGTFDGPIQYTGDFLLYLSGPGVRITGTDGVFAAQTGIRTVSAYEGPAVRANGGSVQFAAYEYWMNFTVLEVRNGVLSIDPLGTPAATYSLGPTRILGDGILHLAASTGQLKDARAREYTVSGKPLNLVGQYDLTLFRTDGGTLLAQFHGDFDERFIAFAGATVAAPAGPALGWLLFGAALTVAGGGTAVAVLRRRGRPESAAAIGATAATASVEPERLEGPAVAMPPVVDGPMTLDAPDAVPIEWDELSGEFGIVKAAEEAGVVVVLVSVTRLGAFLKSVTARGLMAEDTGDRVRAGDHEMAIVTLEPSPLMMN